MCYGYGYASKLWGIYKIPLYQWWLFWSSIEPSWIIYHSYHPTLSDCISLLRTLFGINTISFPSTDEEVSKCCPGLGFPYLWLIEVFSSVFPLILYMTRYEGRGDNNKCCYNFSFGLDYLLTMSRSVFSKWRTIHAMYSWYKVLAITDISWCNKWLSFIRLSPPA